VTDIRVTQAGAEAWVGNPSVLQLTQAGLEAWLVNPSVLRVTQLGIEVWRSSNTAAARPSVCVMT
jgi:hypothetical protein